MSIKSDFKVTSGLDISSGSLKIKGSTGTAGQVLVSGGVDADPIWNELDSIELSGNRLWTFGNNYYGQLGNSTTITNPSPSQTLFKTTNWSSVSCGYSNIAAIKTDGTLWTWGYNNLGQLGDDTIVNKSFPIQTICRGTDWSKVSSGYQHTSAIKTDGTLWSWGYNLKGQLGDNTNTNKSSPVQTIAGGTNWSIVSCYEDFTAAIKTDGTLWIWGKNDYGQLGDNTSSNTKSSPVQTICGGNNWKEISCGYRFSAAIKTDGTLWIWGSNNHGQLGNDTRFSTSSPIQTICGGNNWSKVSSGYYHISAIKTDGTLWIWGYNIYGDLGDNTVISKSSPIQTIAGGTNWSSVSCGQYYTAAIKTNGTLWTWGYNSNSQLGDGSLIQKSSPVQTIAGGANWSSVSCGNDHTAAITF